MNALLRPRLALVLAVPLVLLSLVRGDSARADEPTAARAATVDAQDEPEERPCAASVVLQVCPNEDTRTLHRSAADASPDQERLRSRLRDADAALRARIAYERAHPDALIILGETGRSPSTPKLETFGKQVQDAVRPDCLHDYAQKGLLAPVFMLKDSLSDNGCR